MQKSAKGMPDEQQFDYKPEENIGYLYMDNAKEGMAPFMVGHLTLFLYRNLTFIF